MRVAFNWKGLLSTAALAFLAVGSYVGKASAQGEVMATLSVSPNPAQTGQSVTLTFTCPSCLPGVTGVVFYDGTTALDGGSAHVVYDVATTFTTTFAAGTHSIKAVTQDGSFGTNTVSLIVTGSGSPVLPPVPVSPTPVANFEYDAEGNPTKTIVAPATRNYATQHAYDSLSRRTITTNAKSGVTQFGYDLLDQVTSVTDPRQLVTQYQPTGLGDVKQLTSPDTGTASSSFDPAGNQLTRTDARGVLATNTYDELNRLKQTVYSKSGSASRTVTLTYDQTGASFGYGVGRLTTAATPDASTTFRYDALGRMTMSLQSANSDVLLAVNYTYDAAGHVTSMTYPSGRVINFGWANGQPTSISITTGNTTTNLLDQVVMSAFGSVQSWVWQLGGTPRPHERVYDTNGRMVRQPLGLLVRDISYDDADRISRYTHYVAATAQPATAYDQTFGYDELNRLTNVTASTNWSYAYDANGNRTASSAGASTRGYTTSATSNRLDALTTPARAMGYDGAGNTLTDVESGSSANYTATYSLEGRLASMSLGSASVGFGYDASGRRISRVYRSSSTALPTVTRYAYDQNDHLIGEYGSDGMLITEYVWLGDTPVAVIARNGTGVQIFAVHADHLGTPRVILDASNQVRWRWMGEPFGSSPAEETPTAGLTALKQNLRFPGQQYESFGGRHYNHFRDYDPTIGRYVQSDPIGLTGGLNTYAYVEGNPLAAVDPDGLNRRVITGPPSSYTAPISAAQISTLVTQIRRYDANFNYATIAPRGYRYNERDVEFLRDLLRQYEESAACTANGQPRPRIDYGSTPNGVPFTRHYGAETAPVRNMPGSVIDNTIANGTPAFNPRDGSTSYYDAINNVTVVVGRDGVMSSRIGSPTR